MGASQKVTISIFPHIPIVTEVMAICGNNKKWKFGETVIKFPTSNMDVLV